MAEFRGIPIVTGSKYQTEQGFAAIKNGVKARCRQSMGTTHGVELFSIAAPDISRDLARDIAAFCKG